MMKKTLRIGLGILLGMVLLTAWADMMAAGPGERNNARVVAYVTSGSSSMPDVADITNINYAFGHVNDTFDGVKVDNPQRLKRIARLKEKNPDLEVQLSIGGWGSGGFSEMASNGKLRKKFAADCRRIVEEYGLDGVDIDWEYPTSDAAGIKASPNDTRNYTKLMKELRKALPRPKLLTMASHCKAQYVNFKDINKYVDFVNIMSYDMGKPPRHHSALHTSELAKNSAENAVKTHLAAGVPASKLTVGIPFYGRGKGPYNDFTNYRSIRPAKGCTERWDSVACVPYMTDSIGNLVLTYENPRSIEMKCDFVRNNGLLGIMYWNYDADNSKGELRKAVADGILRRKE